MTDPERVASVLREMRTDALEDAVFDRIACEAAAERKRVARLLRLSFLAAAAAVVGVGVLAAVLFASPDVDTRRRLQLPSGSVVDLERGAVAVARLDAAGEAVSVERGLAVFRVRPVPRGRSFRARTPLLVVTVVGTSFRLTVERDFAEVEVTSGRVEARSRAGEVRLVAAGERAAVGGDGRFLVPTALPAPRLEESPPARSAGASGPARIAAKPVLPPARASGRSDGGEPTTPSEPTAALVTTAVPELEPTPEAGPLDALTEARTLLAARRYDAAAAAARRAGDSREARFVLADALRGADQLGEAANLYRAIANGSDRDAENALYSLARLHLERRGAPARAVALAVEHGQRFPSGALAEEFAITRYEALLRLGRTDEGRAAIDDYVGRWPNGTRVNDARRLREALSGRGEQTR